MPKRIQIAAHLSVEELEQRYRQASDGVERSHYQIIWLLALGKRSQEVAALTGYSRSWIYELVWGYNRIGVDALGDKRHQNPGAAPLLNDIQQAQLWQLRLGATCGWRFVGWPEGCPMDEPDIRTAGSPPARLGISTLDGNASMSSPSEASGHRLGGARSLEKKTGADRRTGAAAASGGER